MIYVQHTIYYSRINVDNDVYYSYVTMDTSSHII